MRHRIDHSGRARGWTVAALALVLAVLAQLVGVGSAQASDGATCPRAGDPNCLVAVPLAAGDVAAKPSAGGPRVGRVSSEARPAAPELAANQLRWNMRNRSGQPIQLQYYSRTRNWVWPGNGWVYNLPADGKTYYSVITCKRGEKVCYGAWVAGNTNYYWGVGYGGKQGCTACCMICGGRQSPIISLMP